MFKFSAEFETIADLAAFVNKINGGAPLSATVEANPKAAKAKKEKAPPAVLTPEAPPTTFVAEEKTAPAAPVVEVKAPSTQDVGAMIEEVKAIMGSLKTKGLADAQIKATFEGIYQQLGLPVGTPVSKLDADQITRFLAGLKDHLAPKENSFI